MENTDQKTKIGNFFQLKILKYELHILGLMILVVCLEVFNIPYSGLLLNLIFICAACIYFFSAFAIPEIAEFTAIDSFLHKLVSLGSSVTIIGILYIVQKWPMGVTMITIGLLTLGMCLVVLVYQKFKNPEIEKFNKLVFLRIVILLLMSGGFIYFG
jgi:GldL N-terminal domain